MSGGYRVAAAERMTAPLTTSERGSLDRAEASWRRRRQIHQGLRHLVFAGVCALVGLFAGAMVVSPTVAELGGALFCSLLGALVIFALERIDAKNTDRRLVARMNEAANAGEARVATVRRIAPYAGERPRLRVDVRQATYDAPTERALPARRATSAEGV